VRELSASIPVKAPAGFALAFLNTYVTDLGGGKQPTLPMRYTISHLAGLTLERDVTVRVEYAAKPGGDPAQLYICWEPDASLFPSFTGTLHAQSVDDRHCTLKIEGTYDAPGGVAGQLFDAVVGVRIAHGTIEGLLARFRDVIEDDYNKRMEMA